LPIELATRNAALINEEEGLTCSYYWNQVFTDPVKVTSLCHGYSFTNSTQLQKFVAGKWFGEEVLMATDLKIT